ncbi:MAG TPA: hypothetical protein VG323_02345 [Thermoanaerobaculia bacterium]|nr:hypothetical protein [Thermoanaerobaculia bacterium]
MPQLTDVPPEKVGETVQSFVDNGTAKVRVDKQDDGNYTVTPES